MAMGGDRFSFSDTTEIISCSVVQYVQHQQKKFKVCVFVTITQETKNKLLLGLS